MTRTTKQPDRPTVLIVGGGVAGLEAMLALRALAEGRAAIELLGAEPRFWYRPLAVAEPFASGRVEEVELAEMAHTCSAGFTLGTLVAVDAGRRVATATNGLELPYDMLVLALGVSPESAVDGALCFRGPADSNAFTRLLFELEESGGSLVFTVPDGPCWPLPAYELALQSALHFADERNVEIALVTAERRPLEVFGEVACKAVEELLDQNRIELHVESRPVAAQAGVLQLSPAGQVRYDQLVALPRLRARPIDGVPTDAHGFVDTDEHGRVLGLDGVYAAGDITSFPVKQGGIAAQQADAVAEWIAAQVGAAVTPRPFRPVLRALLLTGSMPLYLRTELGDASAVSFVDTQPLWWPPTKVVGRYLDEVLASRSRRVLA
jgi:sulfide:quinone oxidoreductase